MNVTESVEHHGTCDEESCSYCNVTRTFDTYINPLPEPRTAPIHMTVRFEGFSFPQFRKKFGKSGHIRICNSCTLKQMIFE